MTIQQILRDKSMLKYMAPLDRELLLSYVLKKPREYIFAHPEKKLSASQFKKFKNLANRRAKGEPIAYLTGKKEFYGLEFSVNRNVLIPRPETELLVELVLKNIQNTKHKIRNTSIIDIGTGSGNIIIAIIKNIPEKMARNAKFFAIDISEKALEVARANAKKHKVDKKIKFTQSDLLKFIYKNKLKGNLIIIANLPYVSPQMYREHKENLRFEPKRALVSGKGGVSHYIRLIGEIGELWKSEQFRTISVFFEISPEQKGALLKIIQKELPSAKVHFFKDLSGKIRVAKIEFDPPPTLFNFR